MELIEQFLDYLTHERGYSLCTVEAYGHDLAQWAAYATDGDVSKLRPLDMTASDLRLWIAEMSRGGMSPKSINRKISSLRGFYRFLLTMGAIKNNPTARLRLPKVPKSLPAYVRKHEMEAILDGVAVPAVDADDERLDDGSAVTGPVEHDTLRDGLIMNLLYATGMRCSELIGLCDVDVDTRRRELKVLGKRNKERVIPFGDELAAAIDRYRSVRDAAPLTAIASGDPRAPLLVRADGRPLYRKLVYNVVHRMLSDGGAHAGRLSPHVMRHSMATGMLNAGASIASVQQLLGHASLTSTQI
ncbi:MAG: tyrosine-type recombinase/integrase, partial [Duncaniella sp.]|nr:tyrosine-type recombinase/integrase [Duncaniella sp.]